MLIAEKNSTTMEPRNTIFYTIFFIASLASLLIPITASGHANHVTALFAFGDSTIDPGNNNHLVTLFRSDHPPYGKDFPGQVSSGRFCDGKLVTDFLAASLGLKELLPAYLDPSVTDTDLLTGVSFASAGSGLDDQTIRLTQTLSVPTQLNYFDEALGRIRTRAGAEEARRIVENALFFISVGSNDMFYNFYNIPLGVLEYGSISDYQDVLLRDLEDVVQRLYRAGARRIAVAGLPPIGCLPMQMTVGSIFPSFHFLQRVCVDQQNWDSQGYNQKLHDLTSTWQAQLDGAKVVDLDIYSPIMDMIEDPAKYGFEETARACCGTGLVEAGPLCNAIDPTCPDASKYIFWDAVHLTEAAYQVIADATTTTALPQLLG